MDRATIASREDQGFSADTSPASLHSGWISATAVELDRNGPVNLPFTPLLKGEDRPLLDLFEEAVRREPDRIIIDDGKNQLSYAELKLAAYLLANEIVANTPADRPVIAFMFNDAIFPVILMAVRASGRPLVSIDATTPADRTTAILREAQASAVVVAEGAELDLTAFPEQMPRIVAKLRVRQESLRPVAPQGLDQPASISFTSGSTGRPKGVVYSERQMVRLLAAYIAANHVNSNDVILSIASVSAVGARDALASILTGARVRLLNLSAEGLVNSLKIMREAKVTLLTFVTSPLRAIMQLPGIEDAFAHLRVLNLIGEATSQTDLEMFRRKLSADCKIGLAFGSTESNTVFQWFVDDAMVDGLRAPSGFLSPHRTIALFTLDGGFASKGEPGELVVSDETVALGYWKAGALVTDAFQPGPNDPGPRTFHTGDIIRIRGDGLMEFAGRIDRMVKIRGLQADLGDIEAALRSVEEIADAVVIAEERENKSMVLIAFVSAKPGATIPIQTLRQTVVAATAEHMAPHAVHILEELPRLHNGKPDLVRLKDSLAAG